MKRLLHRVLNLREGDLARGALLFAYLFLIITTYVTAKVARDALFLDKFLAVQLPYVDISVAVLVGFVVAGYVRIGRRLDLPKLLVSSLLFFALHSLLFWILVKHYHWPWLFPVFYVWAGIFGVLAPAQVWTLANYVLTTREAKRIFGLLGSGGIAGWIFAGFLCKGVVRLFGTEALLLAMAVFIALSAVVVVLIERRQVQELAAGSQRRAGSRGSIPSLMTSLRLVWGSKYLRSVSTLIFLSSYATTMTGWQFKAIAKQFLVHKDKLAAFFADFNLFAGLLCLACQLFLTTRFLRRFGIGIALTLVPMALLASSFGVLAMGTLFSVLILKSTDQVLRYSIDKSTVELLYLPVSPGLKMQVKSFIDTVIWRSGDGLAGIGVLIFATSLHVSARNMSWVSVGLLSAWLAAAVVARREYVTTLRDTIQQHRLDTERAMAPVLDRSTAEIMEAKLASDDPREVLYALDLLGVEEEQAVRPKLRKLLAHPSAQVRYKALALLHAAEDTSIAPQVRELLHDPDLGVRTEALLFLSRYTNVDPLSTIEELGDFPEFSIRSGVAAFLARPGPNQSLEAVQAIVNEMIAGKPGDRTRSRKEAARLLGELPEGFDQHLHELLDDPEPEVVREVFRSVARLRNRRFIPELVEHLADPAVGADAAEALASFGDTVVGTIRDYLVDPDVAPGIRNELPGVLLKIGTEEAAQVLVENLMQGDPTLRFRIISALNKLRRQAVGLNIDQDAVESILAAELLGHYRSHQVLHRLAAMRDDAAIQALHKTMDHERERIFRLLGLVYPQHDLHSAYVGLQSKDHVVHDNALEFLDNVLKPQLRKILVPLLDSEYSLEERARVADRLLGTGVPDQETAVALLIASDDPWLQTCGAHAIGALGLSALATHLEGCLSSNDPGLRDAARNAKQRLAARAVIA
ncbi:MAG TPA: Npt1/Npt2 family nucleotide transporter [Terriglobales bacterium]|nr:Npt1/Npt2 family nucleotide transporter [Terriglobales bacterium]